MSEKAGILYGVSVGPGDAELITVKAIRILEQCPVIAAPRTSGTNTMALDIASRAVDLTRKEILYLDSPMARQEQGREHRYRGIARRLMAVLDTGRDVAVVNIGDISVFSTFSYVLEQVKEAGYRCVTIPGVPSFCACAALLNQGLTEIDQPLCIYPGSYEGISAALDAPGGKVLMKPASALPALRELIREKGLEGKAAVVVDCGLPTQRVCSLNEDPGSYFATILLRP